MRFAAARLFSLEVDVSNTKTTDDLKDVIRGIILDIEPKVCSQFIEDFDKGITS